MSFLVGPTQPAISDKSFFIFRARSGTTRIKYPMKKESIFLIKRIPLLISCFIAGFFGHFLGSEGTAIMITGRNLIILSFLILCLIFLFRPYALNLKNKYGYSLLFIMYLSKLFLISFYCFFLRIYLMDIFSHNMSEYIFFILTVGGGQALPLPAPSDPSSSSPYREDPFEIGVLMEEDIIHNSSFESSLRGRIIRLEEEQTLFLLGKERGQYWADIKSSLDEAPSQKEYNQILDFESRDLQIRERKHSVYALYQELMENHPGLAQRAPYNAGEALIDFFDEKRDELDTHLEWSPAERDRRELLFLGRVEQDFRERGGDSIYIKEIFGLE